MFLAPEYPQRKQYHSETHQKEMKYLPVNARKGPGYVSHSNVTGMLPCTRTLVQPLFPTCRGKL